MPVAQVMSPEQTARLVCATGASGVALDSNAVALYIYKRTSPFVPRAMQPEPIRDRINQAISDLEARVGLKPSAQRVRPNEPSDFSLVLSAPAISPQALPVPAVCPRPLPAVASAHGKRQNCGRACLEQNVGRASTWLAGGSRGELLPPSATGCFTGARGAMKQAPSGLDVHAPNQEMQASGLANEPELVQLYNAWKSEERADT